MCMLVAPTTGWFQAGPESVDSNRYFTMCMLVAPTTGWFQAGPESVCAHHLLQPSEDICLQGWFSAPLHSALYCSYR